MCNYQYQHPVKKGEQDACPILSYFQKWPKALEFLTRIEDPIIDELKKVNEVLPLDQNGYCLFHSKDIPWKEEQQFDLRFKQLWAILKALDSNGIYLSSNSNIDTINLSECTFIGTPTHDGAKRSIDIINYIFNTPRHLIFNHSVFEDVVRINNAAFEKTDVDFKFCQFKETFNISNSIIKRIAFDAARFKNGIHLIENQFNDIFESCDVEVEGKFKVITNKFYKEVFFNETTFNTDYIQFDNNWFEGRFDFSECFMGGDFSVTNSQFYREVRFTDLIFQGPVIFMNNRVESNLIFKSNTIENKVLLILEKFSNSDVDNNFRGENKYGMRIDKPKMIAENQQFIEDNIEQDFLLPQYDGFLSFAEEDTAFAEQLYTELMKYDLKIWFSRVHLKVGDSILGVINKVLSRSKCGIVVLSKNTFRDEKHFPLKELKAIVNKQMYANMKILPIYLDLDHNYVIDKGILFSDYYAITGAEKLSDIARTIYRQIKK